MRDYQITLLGERIPAGCYLLIIHLAEDQQVRFGCLNKGDAVFLPKGDYLYIGSARGPSGSSSLGARLIRHASRCDPSAPHSIRQKLLARLLDAGIPAKVPDGKKSRWHIDYLLEIPQAEITGVVALRTRDDLEAQLAEELAALPETSIPARGLGASDHPGSSHLLRLAIETDWHQKLISLIYRVTNSGDGIAKI